MENNSDLQSSNQELQPLTSAGGETAPPVSPELSKYKKISVILAGILGLLVILIAILYFYSKFAQQPEMNETTSALELEDQTSQDTVVINNITQKPEKNVVVEPSQGQKPSVSDQTESETQRWSDNRLVIWESSALGLQMTAPEWVESRFPQTKNSDGSWNYTDWSKIYLKANESPIGVSVKIADYINSVKSITFLSDEYINQSFEQVAENTMLSAGACASQWVEFKNNCVDSNSDFCYSKDEVINNLIVLKTAQYGPYSAQLRSMNEDFSFKHDCRSEAVWLIQVKNGKYITSNIGPDDQIVKLEVF